MFRALDFVTIRTGHVLGCPRPEKLPPASVEDKVLPLGIFIKNYEMRCAPRSGAPDCHVVIEKASALCFPPALGTVIREVCIFYGFLVHG